jgi:hypothetical protein
MPRHGLFGWVACPHYLGEILSFMGYAMMSDLLPVWGNATVLTVYLSARAHSTLNALCQKLTSVTPTTKIALNRFGVATLCCPHRLLWLSLRHRPFFPGTIEPRPSLGCDKLKQTGDSDDKGALGHVAISRYAQEQFSRLSTDGFRYSCADRLHAIYRALSSVRGRA